MIAHLKSVREEGRREEKELESCAWSALIIIHSIQGLWESFTDFQSLSLSILSILYLSFHRNLTEQSQQVIDVLRDERRSQQVRSIKHEIEKGREEEIV